MSALLTLLGVVTVVPGGAALTFGWLPPWLTGYIDRPRLWGLGMLGLGFFLVTQIPSLHDRFEDAGSGAVAVRYGVLAVGLVAMALSGGRMIRR
ncbi:hypothetical protein [Streptomyces mirabilis]|uniref:hypothetical protein n=1 Tax=Streptomyces mirabilis TaxID=68239 RepID=UPI0036A30959